MRPGSIGSPRDPSNLRERPWTQPGLMVRDAPQTALLTMRIQDFAAKQDLVLGRSPTASVSEDRPEERLPAADHSDLSAADSAKADSKADKRTFRMTNPPCSWQGGYCNFRIAGSARACG